MGLFGKKEKGKKGKANDGKQYQFTIPLSMPLHELLENMGITIENMVKDVTSNLDSEDVYPPSIDEMKSSIDSMNAFSGISRTQYEMLGMDKTVEEKKKEFLHVLSLSNKESEYFIIDSMDKGNEIQITANVYIGK